MAREKIIPITIEDEMQSSYIDYSMSVIVSRALPDVRDGLKPVHRRALFGMNDLGMLHNRGYKKRKTLVSCFIPSGCRRFSIETHGERSG